MAKKDERICIRTTERRMNILKAYTEQKEKGITQVLEGFIDSLEEKIETNSKRDK